ncbi:MAG: hypothetical protein HeimAB125_05890 [Candidatus Heimdallarchaeota archaeon AB_125]|nr:MAG: hypothetical protein HeimAB125_05890 [Candidatus Heimdallarchaeota archaeon AB_125]
MSFSKKKKYVKYELSYKQKQKLFKLANQNDSNPDKIVNQIEEFLDRFSEYDEEDLWEKLLSFLHLKMLEDKINQKSDDIIETKKKINQEKKFLGEYEEDYLTIVELNRALDSLNKV